MKQYMCKCFCQMLYKSKVGKTDEEWNMGQSIVPVPWVVYKEADIGL